VGATFSEIFAVDELTVMAVAPTELEAGCAKGSSGVIPWAVGLPNVGLLPATGAPMGAEVPVPVAVLLLTAAGGGEIP